jgi:hypothetical protein
VLLDDGGLGVETGAFAEHAHALVTTEVEAEV